MLRNSTQVTPLMLARGLTAPSDCVCQSRNLTNNRNVLPGIRAAGKASPTSLQHYFFVGKEKRSLIQWAQSPPAAFCCLQVTLGRAEESMAVVPGWAKSLEMKWVGSKCCRWVWKLFLHLLRVSSQAERENRNEWLNAGKIQSFSPTKTSHWGGDAEDV